MAGAQSWQNLKGGETRLKRVTFGKDGVKVLEDVGLLYSALLNIAGSFTLLMLSALWLVHNEFRPNILTCYDAIFQRPA